jgi:hypothetical protein
VPSFGRFGEILYLVEKASALTRDLPHGITARHLLPFKHA